LGGGGEKKKHFKSDRKAKHTRTVGLMNQVLKRDKNRAKKAAKKTGVLSKAFQFGVECPADAKSPVKKKKKKTEESNGSAVQIRKNEPGDKTHIFQQLRKIWVTLRSE